MLNWKSCSVWNDALLWYKSLPEKGVPNGSNQFNCTSISLALKETPTPDISTVYVALFINPDEPAFISKPLVLVTPFNSPTTVPPFLNTLTL